MLAIGTSIFDNHPALALLTNTTLLYNHSKTLQHTNMLFDCERKNVDEK